MGKIDELIKQFCPDGVKKVPLGDVLDYEQPSKYIVKSTEYDNSYNIPVLTAGKGFLLGYTNEQTGVYAASEENPTIIFDDFVTSFHWVDFPFKVKSSAMKMLTCKDKVNSFRFIYYAMCEIGFVAKEHSRHWISVYSKIEIPLPPLAVQKEIVEILDTFTGMIDNLQKELEQRQKQFEHYRDQMLTFKEGEVQMKPIKEIFETRNGYTPSTKNQDFWEGGYIPWFKMDDIRDNGHILTDSHLHINPIAVKGKGLFKANSIIVATSATIGEHALVKVEHLSNQRFTNLYPKKDWVNMINMKYMYYYMYFVDQWCKEHVLQGGFASVDMGGFYKLEIPIPSLEKQQEIVGKLDTFEALISNIKQEIELRQKQYEYYREKLLAFE